MKVIDIMLNKTDNKINMCVTAIPYFIFAFLFISINILHAEGEADDNSLTTDLATEIDFSKNTEGQKLPFGMFRVFVDKNRTKSIVIDKQDCSIMRSKTDIYGFGFKIGGFLYNMGPEINYGHYSGINWNWGNQLMVAEFQELCTRFNTGRLSKEEYTEEVHGIINRSRNYAKELEERLKKKKDAIFQEIDEK